MQDTLTVEYINECTKDAEKFINECEKEFDEKISMIARYAEENNIEYIFLSGPSSSGKTTFTKKMSNMLNDDVITISLDDYYKNKKLCPVRKKTGEYNFESVNSIDTVKFKNDIKKYINGEEIFLPEFDFITKKTIQDKRKVKRKDNTKVIIEGLHALNPKIYNCCPENNLKIFICPMSTIFYGRRALSQYDIRFIRRMVRDNFYRNSTARETEILWRSVRDGEKIYMKKYMKNSDFTVDTFMPYELCVMKDIALGQLRELQVSRKNSRLINMLELFEFIDYKLVPEKSILNEFLKV